MLQANLDFPHVKLFIYLDSDAVVDKVNFNTSIHGLLDTMHSKMPQWDPTTKPIVFNQDGPCWWCRLVNRVGYRTCLNAGTVIWYRHETSLAILQRWWDSALDPYEGNPIKRRFRLKWPWEQDRQMWVYHQNSSRIQVASHPGLSHMPEQVGLYDWCMSHLPGSGCFISHFCANKDSKRKMMRMYGSFAASFERYYAVSAFVLF